MKKAALVTTAFFLTLATWAQTIVTTPPVKKIEVNGSAEMEITPDEIYFTISLREYKTKTGKVDISKLEEQLQSAVLKAGVAKENLTIANVYGSNYVILRKKREDPEFMTRKQYTLKLNRLDKINVILSEIDADGIENAGITSYSHSKMEEYRKEVKIKAIQAAKAKADYLLEAIGGKNEGILEVQEVNTDNYNDIRPLMANTTYFKSENVMAMDSNLEFKTIKIRAEIRTIFAIK